MTEAEAVARVRPKDVSTMNNCPSMDVETSCQLVESNRSFIQVMKDYFQQTKGVHTRASKRNKKNATTINTMSAKQQLVNEKEHQLQALYLARQEQIILGSKTPENKLDIVTRMNYGLALLKEYLSLCPSFSSVKANGEYDALAAAKDIDEQIENTLACAPGRYIVYMLKDIFVIAGYTALQSSETQMECLQCLAQDQAIARSEKKWIFSYIVVASCTIHPLLYLMLQQLCYTPEGNDTNGEDQGVSSLFIECIEYASTKYSRESAKAMNQMLEHFIQLSSDTSQGSSILPLKKFLQIIPQLPQFALSSSFLIMNKFLAIETLNKLILWNGKESSIITRQDIFLFIQAIAKPILNAGIVYCATFLKHYSDIYPTCSFITDLQEWMIDRKSEFLDALRSQIKTVGFHVFTDTEKYERYWISWIQCIQRHCREDAVEIMVNIVDTELMIFHKSQIVAEHHQSVLLELWTSIQPSISQQYQFMTRLMAKLQHVRKVCLDAGKAERVLQLIIRIIRSPVNRSALAVLLQSDENQNPIGKRHQMVHFSHWKALSGTMLWPVCLDIASDTTSRLSTKALEICYTLLPVPQLSQDPLAQYQVGHMLFNLFREELKTYKDSGLDHETNEYRRMEVLKSLLTVVCETDDLNGIEHGGALFRIMSTKILDLVFTSSSPSTVNISLRKEMNFYDSNHRSSGLSLLALRPANRLLALETNLDLDKDEQPQEKKESSLLNQIRGQGFGSLTSEPPLLSSKVAHSRDELDQHELQLTQVCGLHVSDVMSRLIHMESPLSSSTNKTPTSVDEKCHVIVDGILTRIMLPIPAPEDSQYQELLPHRSPYVVDLHIERWILRSPALLLILSDVSVSATAILKCLPIIKSLLISCIGKWHTFKGPTGEPWKNTPVVQCPPYLRFEHALTVTTELMTILKQTEWIPFPLSQLGELFPLLPPRDIQKCLEICWMYLIDFPPKNITTKEGTELEKYLCPLRQILRQNIAVIGRLYPKFCFMSKPTIP